MYQMNWVFLGADAVTKVAVLGALYLWAFLCPSPGKSRQWVEGWVLTIFMISSLPNTLVIGEWSTVHYCRVLCNTVSPWGTLVWSP